MVHSGQMNAARRFGDPRAASPDGGAAARRQETSALDFNRPAPVDVSFPSLKRLALGTDDRQTRDSDRLHRKGVSPILDLEGSAWRAGSTRPFA